MPAEVKVDRLTICYSDANPKHVNSTCGLLIAASKDASVPGLKTKKTSPSYGISSKFFVPFSSLVPERATIYFQAGPHHSKTPSYRLEFNPAKVSQDGWDDLCVFLSSIVDPTPSQFFHDGTITRCDLAMDFPGAQLDDLIVRAKTLRKHGVYSNGRGQLQTIYVGAAKSANRVVAYQKPHASYPDGILRLERRLKPKCLGSELALIKNPFEIVRVISADFAKPLLPDHYRMIADTIRMGGLKRALKSLSTHQAAQVKQAFEECPNATSCEINWSDWPEVLKKQVFQHVGAPIWVPAGPPQ